LPGRSNALAIAERLGLPRRIIEGARGLLTEDDLIADDLLDELHKKREETRRAAEASVKSFTAVEELRAELRGRLESIEDERRAVLAQAREEAQQELETLRAEMRRLRKRLSAAAQPLDVIRQVEGEIKGLESDMAFVPASVESLRDDDEPPRFRLGDLVWVSSINAEGQITEIGEDEAEVMVGRLRLRAKLDDLSARSQTESKRDKKKRAVSRVREASASTAEATTKVASPGLELDLRGQRIEDAVPALEDYLDAAYKIGRAHV